MSDRTPAERLRRNVVACRRCPRLVAFRENGMPRAAFADQEYWRKPVPGFGDVDGRLLVLGLAPAFSGGNRTGRPFTGDSSGRFLLKALHSCGYANQPVSESMNDGLVYTDCYVTAAVKCAPPGDRPSPSEFDNCAGYLDEEIALMKRLRVVLALGALSFRAYLDHLRRAGHQVSGTTFRHGLVGRFDGAPTVVGSYHPSPRNTNTGKLTQTMLVHAVRLARKECGEGESHSKDN